ncbi:hypothetical protein ACJU26_03640 [Acidithiobacillus sp. M4-SHS-6]|uniref:hypothetical protein n=1 Tax=Acidithiobacillus sp. M4-SHS-6 TaxID=3383024 RepID=UPI0039BE4369
MTGTKPRRRHILFLIVLLGVVVTVTLQIVSGLAMAFGFLSLYPFHVADGFAAATFLAGEWVWLLGTPAGRIAIARLFPITTAARRLVIEHLTDLEHGRIPEGLRFGLGALVEGLFLAFATVTVGVGLLLVTSSSSVIILLTLHRSLAFGLTVLWCLHTAFTVLERLPGRRSVNPSNEHCDSRHPGE